jgi:hypothetical protein
VARDDGERHSQTMPGGRLLGLRERSSARPENGPETHVIAFPGEAPGAAHVLLSDEGR